MSNMRWIALAGVLAAAALGWSRAEAAPEWIASGLSDGGVFETDVTSVTLQGSVVRALTRYTLARPNRDEVTGKPYVSEVTERFDDCARHRYQMGSYVRRDAKGDVVNSSTSLALGWNEVRPNSVAESISRASCAIATPPKEPPIQADLRDGEWSDLGLSADKKYRLQVRLDGVRKLDNGPVIAISRSVYLKPEWIEGFAVRYVVTGTAIDCASGKSASLGGDLFVTPNVRVKAFRTPEDKIEFVGAGPDTFLTRSLQLICAAATPVGGHEHGQGLSVGTAWGVDKGYLVTASHVIEGGARIDVYSNGEKVGAARVVADDAANDLAILKYTPNVPGKLVILPIAAKPATLGRSVFTLGYPEPDMLGQRVKMTAGQVSSTAGLQDDARYLQISIPIQQGNSGGPVINWDGSVVGVVEAKLTNFGGSKEKLAPEMVNYALKAAYLRPMLEDLPDLANYTVIKPAANNEDMVEAARQAVFMVVVIPPRAAR